MEEPEKNYGSMTGQANQLAVLRHDLKSRAAYQPPHKVSSGKSPGRGTQSGSTSFPGFAVARRRPAKDPTDQASAEAWYATAVPAGCMISGQAGPGGTRGSMDGRRRSFHDPRKLRLARGCSLMEGGSAVRSAGAGVSQTCTVRHLLFSPAYALPARLWGPTPVRILDVGSEGTSDWSQELGRFPLSPADAFIVSARAHAACRRTGRASSKRARRSEAIPAPSLICPKVQTTCMRTCTSS